MACIDIHDQDQFNAHKDDKNACLHIRGHVGRVASGGHVGWVDSGGHVDWVASGGHVDWVASGGHVDWVASGGHVGRVASGGHVDWVASGGHVDWVASGGHVDWVDSGGHVDWVASGGSVHAYGGTIKAAPSAVIIQHADASITGGIIVQAPDYAAMSPAQWAEHSGVQHDQKGGTLLVYKAVGGDLTSGYGMPYPVGTVVEAPDWEPTGECGNGLHFSPRPVVAGSYADGRIKRYLACKVHVDDVVVLDATKIKARKCTVLSEVDYRGDPLPAPQRTAPDMITSLAPGEIIVVGTNAAGQHGAGAAAYAREHFGLADGTGEGLSGQSYALPTMEGPENLRAAVARFIAYATAHRQSLFLLTKVGCGIAGYAETEISSLFAAAPANVIRPAGWSVQAGSQSGN